MWLGPFEMKKLTLISLFACSVAAFSHDDQVVLASHGFANDAGASSHETIQTVRVAIIGAGAAGASTAYYLRKFWTQDHYNSKLELTVFERNDYVGGRSTTVNANDDPRQPVELGASIFVNVNKNLVHAMQEFNLSTASIASVADDTSLGSRPDLGIWNGREFVLTQNADIGYLDYARLYWRYGFAPLKTISLMKATVAKFLKLYDEPQFPFASLFQAVHDIGLVNVTAVTGQDFLLANGIGGLFGPEIVQASTRVNYAQNLSEIHGLEAMVCMATDGAMSILGGNWQMFAKMLTASMADVKLRHTVESVTKTRFDQASQAWDLVVRDSSTPAETTQSMSFDHVVLAGPKQFSGIKFEQPLAHEPDIIPYVRLHVTLLTSKHALDPGAFGLPPDKLVPRTVLTTLATKEAIPISRPDFISISLLRKISITDPSTPTGYSNEYIYKIFSLEPANSTFLAHILGLEAHEPEQHISANDISWLYRKEWDSYPYEHPRVTFEEIELDQGLWYTSGIESFISTMETSSLMGMNVARLIADRAKNEGVARI